MAMDKSGKKRIVLKIGSSTLTRGSDHISRGKLEDIAKQLMQLKEQYEFVLVSSGAIATAKQVVKSSGQKMDLNKQALASIGQPHLMRMYYEIFSEFSLPTAQCLLTYRDFSNEESKENIIHTIENLLAHGFLPIINENDTTATEEIKFGDNDKLAAMTAALINADLLIMATNTFGIYNLDADSNAYGTTITEVNNINDVLSNISSEKSTLGSGGMASKIEACEIAQNAGIETWLVYGYDENFLTNVFNNEVKFTKVRSK